MSKMNINAYIDILARYSQNPDDDDGKIVIIVHDDASSTPFLELTMTFEQFVNAAMNRMGYTQVASATLHNIERVGKKLETRNFEFELPDHRFDKRVEIARETVKKVIPDGWTPDMGFSSQGSFFTRDEKPYARTTIRRWVEPAITEE